MQKPRKLIGMKISDFNDLVKSKNQIHLQKARLIPFYKPGDEMALTSIFMSAISSVDKFKRDIFKSIGFSTYGYLHVYTEVEFKLFDRKRIDGLFLLVRSKKIVDAMVIESKNKRNNLDSNQIKEYFNILKAYKIPKILTLSNEFVNFPTQTPMNIKSPKSITIYHLSWSYVLTIAHILCMENDQKIKDKNQKFIMNEVINYLEHSNSGVVGFTQMKPGWTEVCQKINSGASLKLNDPVVEEAISSWIQKERDVGLALSRELGLLVKTGKTKYKVNLSERIKNEKQELVKNKSLKSSLNVEGATSPICIKANFRSKTIEMSVNINSPKDRSIRPQITWMRNQLKKCANKNIELFTRIQNELMLDINVKFSNKPIRLQISDLEDAHNSSLLIKKEIKSFSLVYVDYLGRKFDSRKQFVIQVENMLLRYYESIVQHLKNWEKPAPKIKPNEEK